jgi:starch phosphorylase
VDDETDANSLYDTLENQIVPLYYNERNIDNVPVDWMAMVKESMRTITAQFSTRRMVKEYIEHLYIPEKK